jgi:hypothetical protein
MFMALTVETDEVDFFALVPLLGTLDVLDDVGWNL